MIKGLVDREPELERLLALVDAAASGRGRLILVEGPAGIGKTRLLDAASELAAGRGLDALVARGSELERDFPFGAVRQLLEPHLNRLDAAEHAAVFAGGAAHALPLFGTADGAVGDPDYATLYGLYWLLVALSQRRPLIVCVDDVHWLDAPSLRFLGFLARRIDGMRVLLCGALRPAEPGTDPALISDLVIAPGVETIRPAPLTAEAAGALIAAELAPPEPAFVQECVTTTGGNPFYLTALVREAAALGLTPTGAAAERVRELGPEAIARLLLRRLDALGPGAPELARAVAVLGDGATLQEAAELGGIEHAQPAADALARAGIAGGGEQLAFAHPIVRTSIYADIADRAEQHRRAARLLAERGADLDRVAAQLLAAGTPDAWAIERLRAAATRALQRGAPENAAAYIRRTLDGDPDPELRLALLLALADAERALQDPAAVAHLQEARALARDTLQRATITATLAELLLFAGQWDAAVELPRQALAELGDRDADLALRLRTMGAAAAMFDPQLVSTLDGRIDELLAAALGGGKAGRSLAILLASLLAHRGERLDEIAALVEHGLDDGGLLADVHAESWVWAQAVGALVAIEAVDAAQRVVDAMLADARARGSILGYVGAAACGLYVSAYGGAVAAIAETVQEVLALAQEHDVVFAYAFTLRWGLDAILERPELDAVADFATTLELPPPLATTVSGVWVHEVRAALALRAGDRAAAAAALHRAQPTYEALGFRNPSMTPWRSTVALATGDLALAEAELADARRNGLPRGLGVALRRTALLSGDVALLEEAVAVLEGSAARLEHARALVELGAARRRANERTAAREPLRAGLDLAHRCGAIRLAERATDELRATGARPRREAVSGRDALTASERRVAEMAASGLSNPEIAQALFVTIKTVEGHLSGAYRKLAVRSRSELPPALAD